LLRVPILVALILLLLAATTASAAPDIQGKRAEAQAVLDQVRELDAEVGAAAERWNGANLKLQSLEAELNATRVSLRRARAGFQVAQRRAGDRLVDLYVSGTPDSALEVILGARSLNEVTDLLDARERVADQDARLIDEIGSYRDQVQQRERRLIQARSEQAQTVKRLAAERSAIEARLVERQRLLASVQEEVQELEAEERARQAALRRRAMASLRQQEQQSSEPPPADGPAPAPAAGEPPADDGGVEPPPPSGGRGTQVVAIAMRYLGVPYRWGGASPSTGFDCSGFTMYVYAKIGVSLPHYAASQYGMGVAVSRSQLQPGDLVFFRGLGHMGMYVGGGNFIHAPHTGDVVKISSLSDSYYTRNWVGARRIL
jgi:cell wall-associated NlpC family hydrolase